MTTQLEQMLMDAYTRGVEWALENARGTKSLANLPLAFKAAGDYADAKLSTLTDHPETQPNAFVVIVHPMPLPSSEEWDVAYAEIDTHEGSIAVVHNTKGQSIGWINTHETFKDIKG